MAITRVKGAQFEHRRGALRLDLPAAAHFKANTCLGKFYVQTIRHWFDRILIMRSDEM